MVTLIAKCLESLSDCFYGTGEWRTPLPSQPLQTLLPDVLLDPSCMGQDAVVVKNGSRLCGTGCARASTPILQNKAYWEVQVQQDGIWSCGVASPNCDLNKNLGSDTASWALRSSEAGQAIVANGQTLYALEEKIQEGDILVSKMNRVQPPRSFHQPLPSSGSQLRPRGAKLLPQRL